MSNDNLLERAKAMRETALPRRICSIPGQTGYDNPSLNKGWDFSAVDELVRVVVPELIAEVKRLQVLQSALGGLIIDVARKWYDASGSSR